MNIPVLEDHNTDTQQNVICTKEFEYWMSCTLLCILLSQ